MRSATTTCATRRSILTKSSMAICGVSGAAEPAADAAYGPEAGDSVCEGVPGRSVLMALLPPTEAPGFASANEEVRGAAPGWVGSVGTDAVWVVFSSTSFEDSGLGVVFVLFS